MSVKQSLIDTIVNFITRKKVEKLEKAFVQSPTVVNAIKNMHSAYESMEKQIDDFCKKYPEACKDAEQSRLNR